MNQVKFYPLTSKLLALPALDEGDIYPYITAKPQLPTVADKLTAHIAEGYTVTDIYFPTTTKLDDTTHPTTYVFANARIAHSYLGHKLTFTLFLYRETAAGKRSDRKSVHAGILFYTIEQLDEWMNESFL